MARHTVNQSSAFCNQNMREAQNQRYIALETRKGNEKTRNGAHFAFTNKDDP